MTIRIAARWPSWPNCRPRGFLPRRTRSGRPFRRISPRVWAGERIDLARIAIPVELRSQPLIVEGAGGVLVPMNENQFMLDLMRHLQLPVILASRSTLGTINHTLLSLAALRDGTR